MLSLPLSLWWPFTPTLRVVSERIHVHLRQLAHVKIPYLRTNNWPKETHFTIMVCNAPTARFYLSSLIFKDKKKWIVLVERINNWLKNRNKSGKASLFLGLLVISKYNGLIEECLFSYLWELIVFSRKIWVLTCCNK